MQEKLAAHPIIIKGKMDERGRLFGSVNAPAIENNLRSAGFDLSELRGKVMLDEPLKDKGTYQVPLQFSDGARAMATIIIEKQ